MAENDEEAHEFVELEFAQPDADVIASTTRKAEHPAIDQRNRSTSSASSRSLSAISLCSLPCSMSTAQYFSAPNFKRN
jgi:hypothetical protein